MSLEGKIQEVRREPQYDLVPRQTLFVPEIKLGYCEEIHNKVFFFSQDGFFGDGTAEGYLFINEALFFTVRKSDLAKSIIFLQ